MSNALLINALLLNGDPETKCTLPFEISDNRWIESCIFCLYKGMAVYDM